MNHVPNLLSLSRIVFAGPLYVLIHDHHPVAAFIVFAIALMTDALDGWLARKYGWESELGADVFEPVCDLILSGTAVAALAFTGIWSWWLVAGIVLVAIILQLISNNADRGPLMKRLKRHQHYLHPLFFLVVVVAALLTVLHQAAPSLVVELLVITIIVIVLTWKYDRFKELVKGP